MIENNEQRGPLETFRKRIAAMKAAEEKGELPGVYFSDRPDARRMGFDPEELNEADMGIFEKMEDGSIEMQDWDEYKKTFEGASESRITFKNYVANRGTGIIGKKELERGNETNQ